MHLPYKVSCSIIVSRELKSIPILSFITSNATLIRFRYYFLLLLHSLYYLVLTCAYKLYFQILILIS